MDKILVSKKEAAAALGVSLRTVEHLIGSRQLDSKRIGRRRLVPRVALEKLARRDIPRPALETAATKHCRLNGGEQEQGTRGC